MNRRKLARRTEHARKLNQKWALKRAFLRGAVDGFVAMVFSEDRMLKVLSAREVFQFPGGRVIKDDFEWGGGGVSSTVNPLSPPT